MRNVRSRVIAILSFLALLASSIGVSSPVAAQPAADSTQVAIAHGVENFDGSTMMWQVIEQTAAPDSSVSEQPTGFVFASGDALTINNSNSGGDYLRPGAAVFHSNGSQQIVTGANQTSYTDIALSSNELGGTYTSNGVQTPGGTRAVELLKGTVTSGADTTYTPENEFAYLLHVVDGSISILDDENGSYDRGAGESITVTGAIDISSTGDATYLIASIGPEVTLPELPSEGSGTLTVSQFECAEGTDPNADASSCTPVTEPWFVNIHPSGREDDSADLNIPDDGVNENGSWTWTEMSAGVWYITPAASESETFQVVVTGATAEETHYNAEIVDGEETIVNIYLVGERPTGNGWLDLARLTCSEPMGPAVALDDPTCVRNTDGVPNFTLVRVNDESVVFDQSSATLTNDGFYRVADIPAGVYVISFDVPEESDLRIGVTDGSGPAGGVLRYTVFIAPEDQTIVIYAEGPFSTEPDPGAEATPQS